jgi:hypothetical protein
MLAGEADEAVRWGERAIALAEALGAREILVHALTNVGSVEMRDARLGGRPDKLIRALELAREGGWQEHVARCYANLTAAVSDRDYEAARPWIAEGIEYTLARDLDLWTDYLRGWLATLHLDTGDWAAAEREATTVLAQGAAFPPARIHALIVLGLVRARRGEAGAAGLLDEARDLAQRTAELQRIGPVALARAEAAWLEGDRGRIVAETTAAYALSAGKNQPWIRGMLAVWLRRAGALDEVPIGVPDACALELAGDHIGAAAAWARTGCPFERALALATSGSGVLVAEAEAIVRGLGAEAAVRRLRGL